MIRNQRITNALCVHDPLLLGRNSPFFKFLLSILSLKDLTLPVRHTRDVDKELRTHCDILLPFWSIGSRHRAVSTRAHMHTSTRVRVHMCS